MWRVYKISGSGESRDREFLESAFQKLLLNFTWWVNRKDHEGHNLFSGGFLGLDNIGIFDRSKPLPTGGYLQQADGTAWMGFYCLTMLAMALELSHENPAYEDMASKFFEHFISIADAINHFDGTGLWDERDGFYYDHLRVNGTREVLRTRSMVGLIPMLAVEVLEDSQVEKLKGFGKRMKWFLKYRPDLARLITWCSRSDEQMSTLLALPNRDRLERLLRRVLDETEFLSPHGVRSLSAVHREQPVPCRDWRRDLFGGIRGGGLSVLDVWRELELAWPDLVPDQLPPARSAGALPPLLRRQLFHRMSDGLRRPHEP